ncbi:MAG: MetQ/NlpA family ABC transporter substrate-binding protein [Actinomycetota bacterium]|nr:MetQ/NlpA family ABC transporter substrate-binding protein [Actinomycetota bacterium]MDP3630388.1 MetQ/NlpA family ABC transporter substrate-binding protein [Actinomycetota bacterium]
MKKSALLVLLALSLVLGAFALAGCGAKEEAAAPETEPAVELPAGAKAIKDAGVLRVGVKADVPNFGLQDAATGEFAGMEIDLAKAIAKRIGIAEDKVKFEAVTAKTRGPLLDNGQLDLVIATFTIKPERLEQWNFSKPYYQDEVGLLVKNSSGIKSLADLNGKTVGVAQGATSRDAVQAEADKAGVKVTFLEFATYPEINAALESGRVDAFSVDKSILSGYLTENSTILPDGFSPQDYGIASKKGTDDLTTFINGMLAEMETNGEMKTLLEKWSLN